MTPADWRPSAGPETAEQRASMLARAREYFAARRILEVDTPLLSRSTVTDPRIDSVRAALRNRQADYFLQTSPEYFMKRLLCAGYPDIYQIGKAFRDGEVGRRHQPEFTLVEWYRRGFGLPQIMQDTVEFVHHLVAPERIPATPLFVAYGEALQTFAGVDARHATLTELAAAAGADRDLVASLGEDRDAWLDLVLATHVIPRFHTDRLTVLHHYPASQAALAQLSPGDPSVAERFEVFLGDLELANGFVELRDPDEQLERFVKDLEKRQAAGQPVPPPDARLIDALRHGLPACAGVAVGFDRLLMVNQMADHIGHVQSFAFDEDERA